MNDTAAIGETVSTPDEVTEPLQKPPLNHSSSWPNNLSSISSRSKTGSFTSSTRASKPRVNSVEERGKDRGYSPSFSIDVAAIEPKIEISPAQDGKSSPNDSTTPETKKERSSSLLAKFDRKTSPRKKDKEASSNNLLKEEYELSSPERSKKRDSLFALTPRMKKEKEDKDREKLTSSNNDFQDKELDDNNNNHISISNSQKSKRASLLSSSGSPREFKEESQKLFELANASVGNPSPEGIVF